MNEEIHLSLIEKILSKSATDAEKVEFDDWVLASEQNKKYFEDSQIIWNRLNGVYAKETFNTLAAKEKILSKLNAKESAYKTGKLRIWLSTAAAAMILLLIGFWTINKNTSNKNILAYETSDFMQEFLLPDSTMVWLNRNSSLEYSKSFNLKQREVSLKGEAFFEVKRDESKPFIIKTGKTVTEVLGTSFNIYSEEENKNVTVVVNSGVVAFYEKNKQKKKVILKANEKGYYNSLNREIIRLENKNSNYLSWKSGMLVFYDSPLDEVCSHLSKHYNRTINADPSLLNLSITGKFNNEPLEDILNTIALTLDISVDSVKNGSIVLR